MFYSNFTIEDRKNSSLPASKHCISREEFVDVPSLNQVAFVLLNVSKGARAVAEIAEGSVVGAVIILGILIPAARASARTPRSQGDKPPMPHMLPLHPHLLEALFKLLLRDTESVRQGWHVIARTCSHLDTPKFHLAVPPRVRVKERSAGGVQAAAEDGHVSRH